MAKWVGLAFKITRRMSGNRAVSPILCAQSSPLERQKLVWTQGFKELAYVHGAPENSYRKSTQWLNRVRHQVEGGTPFRSLQDGAQREGSRVLTYLERKREEILKDRDPNSAIPPLYGALVKNEQDVSLLERLAFMHRRQSR